MTSHIEAKPREFWISYNDDNCIQMQEIPDSTHVIEYSAYEELKWFAEQINKYVIPGVHDTGESALTVFRGLTAERDRYRAALEAIIADFPDTRAGLTAKEALGSPSPKENLR